MKKNILIFLLFACANTVFAQRPTFVPYDTAGWYIRANGLTEGDNYYMAWIEDEWEVPKNKSKKGVKLVPNMVYKRTLPEVKIVVDSFKIVENPTRYYGGSRKKEYLKDTILVAPEYESQVIEPNSGYVLLKYSPLYTRCMRGFKGEHSLAFSLVGTEEKRHYFLKKPGYKLLKNEHIPLKKEDLSYYFEAKEQRDTVYFCRQEIIRLGKVEWVEDGTMREVPANAVMSRKGGTTGFEKIVCCLMPAEAYRVKEVPIRLEDIQHALKRKGYYKGKINGVLNDEFKSAWLEFHKDNGIPFGGTLPSFFKILDPNTYYAYGYK